MQDSSPLVSVIVPVYNVGLFLKDCIESILLQTFQKFELILVDDGSTDNSGIICDYYAQEYSQVRVFHQENSGVSSARNLGIACATADWICFVDSDDWIEKDYLANFFLYPLDKYTVVFQGILFDYDDISEKKVPFFQYEDCLFDLNSSSDIIKYRILHNGCPVAKLFNRNLIKENLIRFIPEISTHEDHIFVWSYLQNIKRIRLSSLLSYHYMKRELVSLSTKSHSSDEYLLVSKYLLNAISTLEIKCRLFNTCYLKDIYTNYGLNQLVSAIANMNGSNASTVLSFVKSKRHIFRYYFIGDMSFSFKVFLYLLDNGIPFRLAFLMIKFKRMLNSLRMKIC